MNTTTDATAITKFTRLFELLQDIDKSDKGIPLARAYALLLVLAEPGISQQDLIKRTGSSQPAISRHLAVLADPKGLAFITQSPDPADSRVLRAYPTPQGWAFAKKLQAIA